MGALINHYYHRSWMFPTSLSINLQNFFSFSNKNMNLLNHPFNPPPLLHVHIILLPELTIPTLARSWCPPSALGLILLATAHKRSTTPEAYPNTPQTLMQQGHLLPASVCIEMVGTPATAKQSPQPPLQGVTIPFFRVFAKQKLHCWVANYRTETCRPNVDSSLWSSRVL